MPDFTALAGYQTAEECQAAAEQVREALGRGQDGKLVLCMSADSISELAQKNGLNK